MLKKPVTLSLKEARSINNAMMEVSIHLANFATALHAKSTNQFRSNLSKARGTLTEAIMASKREGDDG